MTILEIQICFYFLFGLIFSSVIMFASYFLAYKAPNKEKLKPYECGFNPFKSANENPFSIKFLMVAILFLLFSLEIIYLLPWVLTIWTVNIYGTGIVIIFGVFLGLGIMIEWHLGGLEWK